MKARHLSLFLTLALILVHGLAAAQGPRRPVLHGQHVPAGVDQLSSAGRLAPDRVLELTIGLPLRHPAELESLLQDLYDPASPQYRHFLTLAQFTERFGPTETDYRAVVAYARSNGFTVTDTDPGRVLVTVRAPVAVIEKAFAVQMRLYRHPQEARDFFAPDVEPTLDLAIPIQDIGGLDTFVVPHPAQLKVKPQAQTSPAQPQGGSASGGAYAGNDFRAAYAPGVAWTGTGESVGLIEFGGYYLSDFTHYEDSFLGSIRIPIVNVMLNGVSSITSNADIEEALDLQVAAAMAPGMNSLYFYYGTSIDTMLSRIASDNAVHQVSASWIYGTSGSTDGLLQTLASLGITYFNASGDYNAYPVGTSFSASCSTPYVTSVGGTTLSTASAGGPWSSETVWRWSNGTGSSGGISTRYALPSWQAGIDMTACQGSTTMRNIPDVALTGDNVFIYFNNAGMTVGGTSCAAPLWAGFLAMVNQQAAFYGRPSIGALNPAVYAIGKSSAYAAAFHDITTGNNFRDTSPTNFPAVAGYDLCTGWGTPTGQATIDALSPPNMQVIPAAGFISYGPPGGPFSITAQNLVLTNYSALLAFDWSLSNLPTWLNASQSSGTVPTNGGTTVTLSLNASVANSLAAGNYSATVLFTNQSQASTQALTFSLVIGSGFDVWTGGGAPNGNWSTAANWLGSTVPASSGDNLVFAGSAQPWTTNNAVTSVGWVTFNPATNFTVSGTALTVTGGMTNSAQSNAWNLPLTLSFSKTFDVASGSTLALGGVVSGAGGPTKTSPGTLLLSATNTYTGATTISAGTLLVGGSGSLGGGSYAGAINNSGSLVYNSSVNQTFSGILSGSGSLTQAGAGTLTLAAPNTYSGPTSIGAGSTLVIGPNGGLGSSKNYGGVISGAGGLTYKGTGTQTLSGASTLTGPTLVNSGVLALTKGGSAGTLGNSAITVAAGAELDLNNSDVLGYASTPPLTVYGTVKKTYNQAETLFRPVILCGGTLTNTLSTSQQAYELFGNYVATAPSTTNAITQPGQFGLRTSTAYFTNAPGSVLTISAVIYPYTAGCPLNKEGTGTLILSAANTYSGDTVIDDGTLVLSGAASIASSPALRLSPTAVLDVSTLNSTFTVGASQSLSAGNPGGGRTNIYGNLSSTGTLHVGGANTTGTLSLNGNLTLTGGTLDYDLGSGACDLLTLTGPGRTLSLGGTITVAPGAGVVPNGTYTLINGISQVTSGGAANLAFSAPGTIRGTATASFAVVPPAVTMTVSGGTPAALTWTGNPTTATWDVATTANWLNGATADVFYNLDDVTFPDNPATNFVSVTSAVCPDTVTFNNASTVYALSGSGNITGAASLTFGGSGTVVVSGSNSFSGGATLRSGTLCLGSANLGLFVSLGQNPASLGTGPLTLSGGTLKFAPGSTTTNYYLSNPITLNGSTIWVEDGEQHLVGPTTVGANGGTLEVKWDTKSLYVDGLLSGAGPLTIKNANNNTSGVHISNPGNTYSGTVTVSASNLTLDDSYALSKGVVNLAVANGLQWGSGVSSLVLGGLSGSASLANGGQALTVGNNNSSTAYSGVLSGSGALTKVGTGNFTLSAINTYTGPTTVSAGTLLVNGTLAPGSAVTVASGGTLGGTGMVRGSTAVMAGGTVSPGNNGIGTLTVSNAVSLAGRALMEVSKSGSSLTSDLLSVSNALTYGGNLTVTNLGATALAMGDSFKLFNAVSYAGAFSSFTLPPLATNLAWDTSKLNNNGTLVVVALPVITNQPQSLAVNSGNPASFSVQATGSAPLLYQWRKNGANLTTATTSSYTIASTTPSDAANYAVVVSNPYGAVTSQVATLTVNVAPTFSALPQSLTVYVGSNATFTASAAGSPAPTYQWQFQGTNLPNATATSLTVSNVQPANEGAYTVVVSNTAGSLTSSPAANLSLYQEFGSAPAPYPSLLTNNGARHLVVPGFQLGLTNFTSLDARSEGSSEDGIRFLTPLRPGQAASLQVVASAMGYLNGWFDFDGSGSWSLPLDQVFTNVALVAGTNVLGFTVPAGATTTPATWARFRFSSQTNISFTGEAPDGEVEDYQVAILTNISVIPNITQFAVGSGGVVSLSGTGAAGQTCILMTASNLVSPVSWTPVATNQADSTGVFRFSETPGTSPSQRFYRLLTP